MDAAFFTKELVMLAKTLIFASMVSPFVFASPVMAVPSDSLTSAIVATALTTATPATQQEKININQANAEQLARVLKGVGSARAQAIIELREKLGGFKDIEDLLQVRGLGVKVLEDNKDRIEL